ncbi:MAG: SWIM zinc finger family protein [Sulfolobales archaeon]
MRSSSNPDFSPRYWGVMNAFRVLTQAFELAQLSVGPDYRPPSKWRRYSRGREEEGVLSRAVRLAWRVRLVRVSPEVVEAEVPSERNPGATYRVRVYVNPLDFECSCPNGEHRFNPSKHVIAAVLKLVWDYMSYTGEAPEELARLAIAGAVHEGLSKLAYLKARALSKHA